MASHSGLPGRGIASQVAPSNGTDLITPKSLAMSGLSLDFDLAFTRRALRLCDI